jgi:cytochrome c5
MAPKGGFHHLTDEEVAAAVDYMADKVKPRR